MLTIDTQNPGLLTALSRIFGYISNHVQTVLLDFSNFHFWLHLPPLDVITQQIWILWKSLWNIRVSSFIINLVEKKKFITNCLGISRVLLSQLSKRGKLHRHTHTSKWLARKEAGSCLREWLEEFICSKTNRTEGNLTKRKRKKNGNLGMMVGVND